MTIATTILTLILFMQPAMSAPPSFTAQLFAAHESVAPGSRTELLVEIEVASEWHIYDPIVLDTGLGTEIKFTAPTGVTIGELRYPPPTLGATAGLEYLEHAGKIRVIAPLTVADSVMPGQELAITAEISGLACKELCLPVETKASLTLSVQTEQGPPANEKIFTEARESLAPSLENAKYIQGSSLRVSKDTLDIDEPAELIASIRVQSGHHIQDRDPGVDSLIPARLFIEKIPGIEFAAKKEQIWPKPHERDVEYIGRVREQSGNFEIRVPFKIIDAEFPSGLVQARVLFQYQACTNAGQCFMPEMAAGTIQFVAQTPNESIVPKADNEPDANVDDQYAAGAKSPETEPKAADDSDGQHNFLAILVFGFLGGLILNVMPCVLPVISIKVISFMQQGGEDPKRVFRLGLAFCAGIMVWFWLFALLSSAGQLPLQYPSVVIGVGTVLFLLAMNLFGVFEIVLPGATTGKLDQVANREGYSGAFFKGFLATLLGTACTAPFLATALIYAASQPWFVGFLVFSSAGLGMSSPYLLLAANPNWLRFIPKPGMWMVTFKQAMGFILLGTGVWLLWILGHQLGADAVVWTVAFWGFLGLATWMIGKITPVWSMRSQLTTWIAALAVALVGYYFSYHIMYRPQDKLVEEITPEAVVAYVAEQGWEDRIPWAPYGKGIPEELSRRGYTVYVDYTATWCGTCLANKAAVLETDDIRSKMEQTGVIPIKADFSNSDPEMLAEINSFGRPSVPLNLVYAPNQPNDPQTLPIVLSKNIVRNALDAAGKSKP